MLLLELIHKTRAKHNDSSLMRVRAGLDMVWSQRDLEADEDEYSDLSYLYRLDTIISSACTLPFFHKHRNWGHISKGNPLLSVERWYSYGSS